MGRTVCSEVGVQKKEHPGAYAPQKSGAANQSGFFKEAERVCVYFKELAYVIVELTCVKFVGQASTLEILQLELMLQS